MKFFGGVLLGFSVLAFAVTHAIGDMELPCEILLTVPEHVESFQNPVLFPHGQHVGVVKCNQCHHKFEACGSAIRKCSDQGCHADFEVKSGHESFYAAFHSVRSPHSCIGCHRAMKQAEEKTGPVKCTSCHPQD